MIQVKDTGIGISQDNMKKLFKNFGKLKDKNNMNENGCGLGLQICKKIAESMQGSINVESEYGKGSIFTFKFKL